METLLRRLTSKLRVNVNSSYYTAKCLSYKYNQNKRGKIPNGTHLLIGSTIFGLGLSFFKKQCITAGVYQEGLPDYTPDEIAKHVTRRDGVWVTYKDGVYDITDYLKEHPGGEDTLMQAAGKSIEPFWAIFTGHENNEEAYKALEIFRIGNLKRVCDPTSLSSKPEINSSDYGAEPKRDNRLKPVFKEPFVGGPMPTSLLTETFLTPNDLCYIHNHMPVPNVNMDCYQLRVEIQGKRCIKTFSLEDLQQMPSTTVTASMQCASNRSLEMAEMYNRKVQDAAWEHNAICTAEWTGVLLLDILKAAGFDPTCECNQHIQFESVCGPTGAFTTSIPLWRMLNDKCEVLIAYKMNGCPLSRDHGYPLRVVIPGVSATRWVKWLYKIRLQEKECKSEWHKKKFKILGPSINSIADLKDLILEGTLPVQEMPVTSAICNPLKGSKIRVSGGQITVDGYAYSGGGRKILKVEVSIDQGKTWIPTTLSCNEDRAAPYHWTWAIWTATIPVPKETKEVEIWSKATDSSFNTQPQTWQWNFSGVGCNTIHKIRVECK